MADAFLSGMKEEVRKCVSETEETNVPRKKKMEVRPVARKMKTPPASGHLSHVPGRTRRNSKETNRPTTESLGKLSDYL